MQKIVALIATVDTKAGEAHFIKEALRERGLHPILIDVSCKEHQHQFKKDDIPNKVVAEAGGLAADQLSSKLKAEVASKMAEGAAKLVAGLYGSGHLDGVIGIGGAVGSVIVTSAMRALPIGVPKVCVSTIQHIQPLVGSSDIAMFYPVTDISGGGKLNRFERVVLANAVGALQGMIAAEKPSTESGPPLLLTSMLGSTTPCVTRVREALERVGYELAIFHATGTGGRTMEEMIRKGCAFGVLDITTSEVASELVGGPLTAGPSRLEAAAESGMPQVVCPGGLDIIPFWGFNTIPRRFRNRMFHQHSPLVVNMRTSRRESIRLAKVFAEKINKAKGPTTILIPERGWSEYDIRGGVKCVDICGNPTGRSWYDPEADEAFTLTLERLLDRSNQNLSLIKVDAHINDGKFASEVVKDMVAAIEKIKNRP